MRRILMVAVAALALAVPQLAKAAEQQGVDDAAVVTLGGGAEASTTAAGGADIYALAESAGLFGGVAIQGGIVKPLADEDHRYYGGNVTAQQIVLARGVKNPGAEGLRNILRQVARP